MTLIPDTLYWELRARHADVELARARLEAKQREFRRIAEQVYRETGEDVTLGTYDLDDDTRRVTRREETSPAGAGRAGHPRPASLQPVPAATANEP